MIEKHGCSVHKYSLNDKDEEIIANVVFKPCSGDFKEMKSKYGCFATNCSNAWEGIQMICSRMGLKWSWK